MKGDVVPWLACSPPSTSPTSARDRLRPAHRAGPGRRQAVDPRPVPAGLDRPGDGRRPAARADGAGAGRGAVRRRGRRGLAADRRRAARDDVPGARQGPLRPAGHGDRGPTAARLEPRAQLARRARPDVRAGLAAPAGPARVPDRPHHRGAGPLHRHGDHLERPGVWRPGGGRGARGPQLGLPGARVRRAGVVLPVGAAGVAGPAAERPRHLAVADRHVGRSSSSASRWLLGYLSRRLGERTRGRPWYEERYLPRIGPWALYGLLFTIVILFALQGEQITSRPLDVARIALPLLAYFAVMWGAGFLLGRGLRMSLRAHHHPRLHRRRQQLRAGDRGGHRRLRRHLGSGPGRGRRPADRGARPRRPGLREPLRSARRFPADPAHHTARP